MRNKKLRSITLGATVAALYVLFTWLSGLFGLASGAVQLRLSEMLCVLPIFFPSAIPGLFFGCMLANLLNNGVILDIVFGSLATLLGAVGTFLLRRRPYLALIPPILANTAIVPFILVFGYGLPCTVPSILFSALTVCVGEVLSCGVLGIFFVRIIKKYLPNLNEIC